MTKYQLVSAELDEYWDKFVMESPQGSVFSIRAFLRGGGYNALPLYLKRGNHIVAAFSGVLNGNDLVIAPHLIHGGIMFRNDYGQKNTAQINALQFEITTEIIENLTKSYRNVAFNLHPSFVDMRPFQWYNYGADKPRFKIDTRFTSIINNHLEMTCATQPGCYNERELYLYNKCSNTRKQTIREKGIVVTQEYLPTTLLELFKEALGNHAGDTNIMLGIMEALKRIGKLRMFVARQNDKIGSIAAFGIHRNIAYNLFQAGKLDNCATHAIWQGMKTLAQEGISKVDLEGINSPKRGAFKLSFGGNIIPYYQVSLCQ